MLSAGIRVHNVSHMKYIQSLEIDQNFNQFLIAYVLTTTLTATHSAYHLRLIEDPVVSPSTLTQHPTSKRYILTEHCATTNLNLTSAHHRSEVVQPTANLVGA